jgi:hypothetical protein
MPNPPDLYRQLETKVEELRVQKGQGGPRPGTVLSLAKYAGLSARVDDLDMRLKQLEKQRVYAEGQIVDLQKELRSFDNLSICSLQVKLCAIEAEGVGLKEDVHRLNSSVYAPTGEYNLLHEQVSALRVATQVGRGVECHGLSFGHPSEVATLLRVINGSVGIFHDATSILHAIGSSITSHRSALTDMKAQRDVKISTDKEAIFINFPAILYGGSSAVTAVEAFVSSISKLKSYEV